MKRLSVINRKAEQDGYKTYVLFKVAPNPYTGEDEIDAFFQYKGDRSITVYSHVGQHGEADKRYMDGLKNASPKEYAPLMKELNSIGYDVVPVKKFTITDPDKQKRSVVNAGMDLNRYKKTMEWMYLSDELRSEIAEAIKKGQWAIIFRGSGTNRPAQGGVVPDHLNLSEYVNGITGDLEDKYTIRYYDTEEEFEEVYFG